MVIDLTVDAWTPVFAKTQLDVPRFVHDAFYLEGWEPRQKADVAELLEAEPQNIWLAFVGQRQVGFVGFRIHVQDQMGEICIIAVSPRHQRQGIGRQLMQFAERHIRACGMKMVMEDV